MNRVNELIKEYCPDGVPFQKVKDVYTRVKGTPITAGKMKEIACDDGEIRIFAGGKTIIDAHEKDIPKANITRVPAVLCIMISLLHLKMKCGHTHQRILSVLNFYIMF